MDAGAGLLEVLDELPAPTRVACDVRTTLADAPRLFGPQKGAIAGRRRASSSRASPVIRSAPCPDRARRAAWARRSRRSAPSSSPAPSSSSTSSGFDPTGYDLVVTGEGTVDETTWEGKAPGGRRPALPRRRRALRPLRRTRALRPEAIPLSGDPARAYDDLVTLGVRLGARDLAT